MRCLTCNGHGRIERQHERSGLLGKLRGPKIVSEKCATCNGTGAVLESRPATPQASTPGVFELRLPEGDAVCSDNYCPCGFPGAKIPREGGYVVLSEEIIGWRTKFPSLAEWDVALASIQSQTDAGVKKVMTEVLPPSGLQPIVCCDQSPLLEIVDRQVATADAQMMWKSARLPLRATPLKGGNGVFSDKASLPARQAAVERVARERVASEQQQHYVLKCRSCDFTHPIPKDFADNQMTFAVEREKAKFACIYGTFSVSLEVGEFFTIQSESASRQVLHAEIAANMKVLHPHMLSHCDPLFFLIVQTPTSTAHHYKRKQQDDAGVPYVRYTGNHGTDFVGYEKVNVGKAEIPGVSWKIEQTQPTEPSEFPECGCLPFFAAFLLANPYGFKKRTAIYASRCAKCGTGYYTFLDKERPIAREEILPKAKRGKFSDATLDAQVQAMIKRASEVGIPASEIDILKTDATPGPPARTHL